VSILFLISGFSSSPFYFLGQVALASLKYEAPCPFFLFEQLAKALYPFSFLGRVALASLKY